MLGSLFFDGVSERFDVCRLSQQRQGTRMDEGTRARLALRLRAARVAKGLSQTELANLCGLDQSDISNLERNTRNDNPTVGKLLRIATALDTTLGNLIES